MASEPWATTVLKEVIETGPLVAPEELVDEEDRAPPLAKSTAKAWRTALTVTN